jgi:hypothetical protein
MDHAASAGQREEIVTRRLVLAAGLVLLHSVAAMAQAAEPLGRLFYTPAQRAQLDVLRSQKNIAAPAPEPEQPAPAPEVVKYEGIVQRSDGRSTVWINSRQIDGAQAGAQLPTGGRLRPDRRIRVKLPQGGRDVDLKVGQRVDMQSGSVEEPYAHAAGERVSPSPRPPQSDDAGEVADAPHGRR